MGNQPDWAVEPVMGCKAAARLLGVSVRKLSDMLKEHPHYERRGRAYAFYPEHIQLLRAVGRPRAASALAPSRHRAASKGTAFQEALEMITRKSKEKK